MHSPVAIKFTSLFLFTFAGIFSQAQRIQVSDYHTRLPVSGVHAVSLRTGMVSVSGPDGILSPVPATGIIRLSHLGYRTIDVEYTGDPSDTIWQLSPVSVQLLNTLTVTASRAETTTWSSPRSVGILDHQAIQAQSPRTVPEALFRQTGVWVQKTNHGGGSPVIRGMMGNQVLLLVDGIRMNNSTYRFGPNQYLSTLDSYLLDRVEVVRGSGSVLYGSDAMGGVVQSLTTGAAFTSSPQFRLTDARLTGTLMTGGMEQSGNLQVTGASDKTAVVASGSMFNFGDLIAGGSLGAQRPTGYRQQSAAFRFRQKLGSNSVLTVAHQTVVQRNVPRWDQVVQGGYSQYEFDPQSRRLDYARLERFIPTGLINKASITVFNIGTEEGLETRKNGSSVVKNLEDKVATNGFIGEIESRLFSKLVTRAGVEYYHDFVSSTAKTTDVSSGVQQAVRGSYADGSRSATVALFMNHELQIGRFTLSGGLRQTGTILSIRDDLFGDQRIRPRALVGSVSSGVELMEGLRLYGTVQSGFRAPTVDDLSKFGTVETGVFEIPATGLTPERSLSREAGLKFVRGKLAMGVGIYRTSVDDLIERVPAEYLGSTTYEGRTVYRKANNGKAQYDGVEVEFEWNAARGLSLLGNGAWTKGANLSRNEPARRIPPVFGNLGLRYLNGNFSFTITAMAAGRQDRLAPGDLSDPRISIRLVDGVMPGWNTLDVSAGWQANRWSAFINLRNLFDKAYRVYSSGVDGYGRHATVRLQYRLSPASK